MKNLAKQIMVGVMLVVLSFSINIDETIAKGNEEYKENIWYEESGELTEYHKDFMKDQWCKFNADKKFAKKNCEE